MLVVVNLDPHHKQSGFVNLALEDLNIDPSQRYQVHDLLTGARYLWNGARNYVELDPQGLPAHIFAIRRRAASTENDFDYFRVTLFADRAKAQARPGAHDRSGARPCLPRCLHPEKDSAAVCGSRFDTDRSSRTCFHRARPRPTPTRQHCAG